MTPYQVLNVNNNSTLWRVIITDNSGESPQIYTGHANNLQWVLLSKFTNSYFVYSWNRQSWKSITYAEFINLRSKYQSLVLETGVFDRLWYELPLTQSYAKQVNNSKVKTKKAPRQRDRIALHSMASMKLSDSTPKFTEVDEDDLLPGLAEAHSRFIENW